MDSHDSAFADEDNSLVQDAIRQRVAAVLLERLESITDEAVAVFPFSGAEPLDPAFCRRVGHLQAQLLAFAVRDGTLDVHGELVADLYRVVLDRGTAIARIFALAYLIERTALDELALDETFGATSEPWPTVAQTVRQASFDLLAAYAERAQLDPGEAGITDRLTTLFTRQTFEAMLVKEVERAGRFGDPISLILFDVDRLSAINQEHGYGVGDMILERLGILIRQYFRQHDWVARHSGDSIAVLLTRADADVASDLAERVRHTVEERLGSRDHRTDRQVEVTVSAAVVNVNAELGSMIDPQRLMAAAEAALEQAKRNGRNRVERVNGYSASDEPRPLSTSPDRQGCFGMSDATD
jgi:diguanylate cyclase (GGDEF)-like protein